MDKRRNIVVIGASTGGLGALKRLLARLPADFPATVLVVMHIGEDTKSILPQILLPHSSLPVRHPVDREPIEPGTVLVAPSGYHLLVEMNKVRLSRGPKENFARPAIDPLFRSAALAYRARVIGVVLTGNLDDGTLGLQAIKTYGGLTIVQDPAEAEASSMPRSALEHAEVDYCLPLDRIADTLAALVEKPIGEEREEHGAGAPEWISIENRFISTEDPDLEELEQIGKLSMFTCPECHGSLWEIKSPAPLHFRCHTGHGFTALALAATQNRMTEEALWAAIRALHEKESLLKRVAKLAEESNRTNAAAEHEAAASQAADHAEILRKMMSG